MKRILRRALALIMCLSLLPFAVLADETKQGYAFDVSFEMDASAYPEEQLELLGGFADLLNMLTLTGTAVREGDSFDTDFTLLLNGNESTRTAFKLYGTDSNWQLESSLLGTEKVMFNNKALLEFALKAYFHLDMPLQYIALAICPYAHESAMLWIRQPWRQGLLFHDGSRIISRERIDKLAAHIVENAEFDPAFYNWVSAIGAQTGYSDMFFESLYVLQDWLDSFLAEEGITVTVNRQYDREVWKTGEYTLFKRVGDDWALTLPASLEGDEVSVACTREGGSLTLTADILTVDGESKLDFDLNVAGLPEAFPFTGDMTAQLSLSGLMFEESVELAAAVSSDGETVTLSQVDPETGAPMLSVIAAITPTQLPVPAYVASELDGLSIYSVNDESLSTFVRNVMEPFMTGFLPILVELPASSYNSIFELLNQYGVLDLLTAGL